MNILFVLYGDFDSNSANPLVLYARELHSTGHRCAVAVPSNLETVSQHANPAFRPILYGDVLAAPDGVFPDGRAADVIHACTPREVVRHFVASYMARRPTPLVLYLEDNESWISTRAIGMDENALVYYTEKEIAEKLPGALAHPFRYDSFIGLADAVAVIQEKLKIEVPPWVYCETVMIGVDLDFFSPRSPEASLRKKYGVAEHERIIVYHGGVDPFKKAAIETLCHAVGLINRQGYSCRLLRTGLRSLPFLEQLPCEVAAAISDLGVLPKEELPALLALADVFVQPGKIDPFEDLRLPGKVPEFLAMGRPVVMPDVNIAHLFRDGLDAVLLRTGSAEEIAEKCIALFSDPKRAGMMGRAGRLLAEKYFDVRSQARHLEDVYKTACNQFNPAIASEVWRTKNENTPVTLLLARKLRLLADWGGAKLGFESRELLKEHARYIELMQQRVKGLEAAVVELNLQNASTHQAVAERDALIGAFVAERNYIFNSISWRITSPMRVFRLNLVNRPYHFMRRIASEGARQVWLNLPVSTQSKQLLKHRLFSALPYLFRRSQAYQSWRAMNAPIDLTHDSLAGQALAQSASPTAGEFVPLLRALPPKNLPVRLIAFYLPQFHAIAENNAWWGEGFTEWTNVKPAQPQFEGHYQPRIPGELGYYDLLDPAVQRRQVELARLYGVGGFCFYLYWFGGKLLLEKPVENYWNDRSLDLPFCLCWANENWSRRWDGLDRETLIAQKHSPEDDLAFIQHVAQYMRDERYIRIDGKPLLLVYRPGLLPSAKETAERWRHWCQQNGVGDIFLAYTQSFEAVDPGKYGFDAAIEFPPNNSAPPDSTKKVKALSERFGCTVYDWGIFVGRSRNYRKPSYKLFRGVCPSWDNTARRKNRGTVFLNNSPQGYQEWLTNAVADTCARIGNPDERFIFVNAWNEWAEGAYLEPDQRHGYAYLEATRLAMIRSSLTVSKRSVSDAQPVAIVVHAFYEDIFVEILEYLKNIAALPMKLYVTTTPEKEDSIHNLLISGRCDFLLRAVENRGRDILPFMKIMPDVVSAGHDFFVKVHTKKSLHRKDGDKWRKDLYSKLMDGAAIAEAIRFLKKNSHIGILSPDGHLVGMSYFWGSNAERVTRLASRMGVEPSVLSGLSFSAGSMFIARVDAMVPLLNLAIDDSDFEPERGQTDGTLAHAIERLFSVSAHSIRLRTTCPSNVALTEYEFVKHR